MNLITLRHFALLAVPLLLFPCISCAETSATVASIGAQAVSVSEAAIYGNMFRVSALRVDAPGYLEPGGARAAVEDILAERWLAGEAKSRGIVESSTTQLLLRQEEFEALAHHLNTKLSSIIEIPEDEVRRYYEENAASFGSPEMARFTYFFHRTQSGENLEQTSTTMQKLRTLLSERGATVAVNQLKELEVTTNTVETPKGRFAREVDEVVFSLQPGELSHVFQARHGLYIVKVHAREPERHVSFADARAGIKAAIRSKQLQAWGSEIKERLASEMPTTYSETFATTQPLDLKRPVGSVGEKNLTLADVIGRKGSGSLIRLGEEDVTRIKNALDHLSNRLQLEAWAEKEQLLDPSEYELLKEWRHNRTVSLLTVESITDLTTPTAAQLRTFYDANPDLFVLRPEWTVRELFLAFPSGELDFSPAERYFLREELRKVMTSVRSALLKSEPAESVVGRHQPGTTGTLKLIDHGKAPQGPRGFYLDTAVAPLSPGDVSPLTLSDRGVHIYIVDGKTAERRLNFDESQERVVTQWRLIQALKARQDFVEEAYRATMPKWNEDALQQLERLLRPD